MTRIATIAHVSRRTVTDWKSGKYTVPYEKLQLITNAAGLDLSLFAIDIIEDWSHTSRAGRKGAAITIARYGPPGTLQSRKKGGHNSYLARRTKVTDIFARNPITIPARDEVLAEFMGIMIGDGTLSKYQASIALNSIVDVEYGEFVQHVTEKLFGLRPAITLRTGANCFTITCSSIELVSFLVAAGLPIGSKIVQNHSIPDWIMGDPALMVACLRGVFDTDGCIYLEKHVINGKSYCYPRLSFVSASSALRQAIYRSLLELQLQPKIRNDRSVNLEKREDIKQYYRVVGSHNPKHLERFRQFGGVG